MNSLKLLSVKSVFNLSLKNNLTKRNCSNKVENAIGGFDLVESIVESDDKKMFVAWHPKKEFPYECSRPIPKPEDQKSSSLLKESAVNTAMAAFKNKHPEIARQELMKLTHTTKHRWFPRSRDKRAKNTPMDRKYL